MCGIHGEFAFSGNVDLPRAEARLARLARRGPDGFGIGFGDFRGDALRLTMNETPPAGSAGNAFLGHRRLSIVDLSDAALQPMATADGNYVLLFNGEIYNAAELRPVLEARGHRFVTHHSDTEVLLRAFVEWGERCLPYFVGMFAFAVYCRRERKVFLARDRIGQKPLYYRMSREGFGFSSELTALAVGERERAALDREALAQYLMFGYVPDPRSILAGIAKLPPAHCAWVDLEARTFHARPYWDVAVRPASEDETAPPLEWRRRVHDALEKAVARRLIADVPIGVFLSGGIDSTLIAKMIAKHHDGGIRAYTAEFAARSSERRWAEQAAERYKLDLSVTLIDLDAAPRYHEVLDALDEPYDGGSALASFDLFRGAVGGVKVMLTGDGGDELFAGYARYQRYAKRARAIERLRAFGPAALGLDLLGRGLGAFAGSRRAGALARGRYLLAHLLTDGHLGALDLLREPPERWDSVLAFAPALLDGPQTSAVRAAQYLELKTILPGRMLFKLDRCSMAWSIEGRSPFMDHELVELAFRTPESMLIAEDGGKRVLRDILLDDFDAGFVNRRKTGFFNPLSRWLAGPEGPKLLGRIADPAARLYRYLDYERVQRAHPEIRAGFRGGRAAPLWRLVALEHYLEASAGFVG
jgi:asparagine synthase (glutamine-hydrolysing)